MKGTVIIIIIIIKGNIEVEGREKGECAHTRHLSVKWM